MTGPKHGDVVDVAGYEYTLWERAPKAGCWHATRTEGDGATMITAVIKQTSKHGRKFWKVVIPGLPPTRSAVLARTDDPSTSHAAAVAVAPKTGSHKFRLLVEYAGAVDRNGLTDAEAAARAYLLGTGYWKRCSDLRNDGFIAPLHDASGNVVVRYTANGDANMVCAITDKGLAALPTALESNVSRPEYVHSVCVTCGGADASHYPDCERLADTTIELFGDDDTDFDDESSDHLKPQFADEWSTLR